MPQKLPFGDGWNPTQVMIWGWFIIEFPTLQNITAHTKMSKSCWNSKKWNISEECYMAFGKICLFNYCFMLIFFPQVKNQLTNVNIEKLFGSWENNICLMLKFMSNFPPRNSNITDWRLLAWILLALVQGTESSTAGDLCENVACRCPPAIYLSVYMICILKSSIAFTAKTQE